MYKLTEEEIKGIILEYGGSISTIEKIEKNLNLSGKVQDEEDYKELVVASVSFYESMKLIASQSDRRKDRIKNYMSLEEITETILRRYEIEKNIESDVEENDMVK